MNAEIILSRVREELAEIILANPIAEPFPETTQASIWVSISLLQKAIRRGRTELALQAAAALVREVPDRLWRRLGVIAWEDVGLGDIEAVTLVTAALTGRRFRAKLGGEWAVASYLVRRLAAANKCRASDDLVMVVERHLALSKARRDFATLPTRELFEIAIGSSPLPQRALALWFALGTSSWQTGYLPARRGEPAAVFDALCDAGIPDTLVETAREGFRKLGQVLCPFVAFLHPLLPDHSAKVISDDMPEEQAIDGIPTFAFDMFVREGRAALRQFLDQDTATSRWVRQRIPACERINFLGHIVFAVEGGLLRSRLEWPTGAALRRAAEIESQGRFCHDASEVIELLRADLPALNRVRAQVC